jgi:hypothetical protein
MLSRRIWSLRTPVDSHSVHHLLQVSNIIKERESDTNMTAGSSGVLTKLLERQLQATVKRISMVFS